MRGGPMRDRARLILLSLGVVVFLLLFVLVERSPGLFANATYLGAILALQVVFVGLTHFEEVFFPLLMGTFLGREHRCLFLKPGCRCAGFSWERVRSVASSSGAIVHGCDTLGSSIWRPCFVYFPHSSPPWFPKCRGRPYLKW